MPIQNKDSLDSRVLCKTLSILLKIADQLVLATAIKQAGLKYPVSIAEKRKRYILSPVIQGILKAI